jgi:hypothetical protein
MTYALLIGTVGVIAITAVYFVFGRKSTKQDQPQSQRQQ